MSDLFKVSKAMFTNREEWVNITEEEKDYCFFIFNRYLSKEYPEKSILLNDKNIDKSLAMDVWFKFFETNKKPKYFWSKTTSIKEKDIYTDKEIKTLLEKLNISKEELSILVESYPDLIKEELKYYKELEKNEKK